MSKHPANKQNGNKYSEKWKFSILSEKVIYFIGGFILLLSSISIIITFLRYVLNYNNRLIEILQSLFYLDNETNIPTFWSSLLLLTAALLLGYIFITKYRNKAPYRYNWLILAGVFLFLSMDEYMSVHERMTEPVQAYLQPGDWLYLAWVIPASIALGIGLLFYLKFLFSLRLPVRKRFIYAALIYVGGAIGLELVGGYIIVVYGMRNFMYAMAANLEETLEMVGVALFIYALLRYISKDLQQKMTISFPLTRNTLIKKDTPTVNLSTKNRPPLREHPPQRPNTPRAKKPKAGPGD